MVPGFFHFLDADGTMIWAFGFENLFISRLNETSAKG
jgi:hypothetical protein